MEKQGPGDIAADARRASEQLVEERRESKKLITTDALLAREDLAEERRDSKELIATQAELASGVLVEQRREARQVIADDAEMASQQLIQATREARHSQALVAHSLDSLRALVDSVVDYAVFMLDPNGFVTTWNPGAQRLKGYERNEIIGRHFSVFHTPEDIVDDMAKRELAVAAVEGQYEGEGWRVRKGGSRFWAGVVITAVYSPDGSVLSFGKVIRDLTERRNAEQSLSTANSSLDSLRIMIDAVIDYAVFILDPLGIVTTWNAGAERIKGYNPAEVIGKHFSIFYPPEAIAEDLPGRELRIAAQEGRCENEGWRVRKNGSRFWASVIITALRTPDHVLIGFGKVTRDLTERSIADEALRESNRIMTEVAGGLSSSNRHLKGILEASIFSSIIATRFDGTITTFNRGAELMLGYAAADVVGKSTPVLFHVAEEIESTGRVLSERLGRLIQGFEVFSTAIGQEDLRQSEWTYIHKDGHPITVNLSLSVIEGEDRQPVGFLGVANDVTAQRRSAEQLAKAYAQLNSVLACTSDSVITIEQDWTMLYGNRRALEMLPDLVIGKSYWSCFPGVSGTPLEQRMKTAMETRVETSYEIFYEPYQQWFKGRVFPTDTGVSVFFSNCTEEKRMHDQIALEQDLREKRIEALSHMAGGLAHEISNPLAIIHALASDLNARAIGEQSVSSVDVSKASDSIVKTSDRAIRILNGLRGFGREAGKDPMEWASPYNIIEQCRDLQQARFERHNVKLDFNLPPDLPLMLCREVQVGQIVTNLLNNAFDAIDQSNSSERWVTLNAGQVADTIVIDVTDSGPGIQDKFRPHLMDPFFTTKKVGLGMGVGLSLSRAIAHDHGGTLALCSDTPNTCFQLILPINADVAKQENGMPQD